MRHSSILLDIEDEVLYFMFTNKCTIEGLRLREWNAANSPLLVYLPNSDSGRIFTWHLTLALLNLIIYCSVVSLTCCLIRAKSTMDTPGSVLEKWDWNWFCMSSQVKIELGRRLTYQVKAWPVNELGKSLNFR